MMRGCLLIVALLCIVSPVAAQSKFAPERANPYKNLFNGPRVEQVARAQQRVQAAVDAAKPRVVCGMTLIPANPAIDPKMAVEPKADQTRYTIRAIEPPICRQR